MSNFPVTSINTISTNHYLPLILMIIIINHYQPLLTIVISALFQDTP